MDQNRARAARHTNDGLYKRCDCARRSWLKCEHGWHFDFYKGRKFRYSLDVIAAHAASNRHAPRAMPKRCVIAFAARSDPARSPIRTRSPSRSPGCAA